MELTQFLNVKYEDVSIENEFSSLSWSTYLRCTQTYSILRWKFQTALNKWMVSKTSGNNHVSGRPLLAFFNDHHRQIFIYCISSANHTFHQPTGSWRFRLVVSYPIGILSISCHVWICLINHQPSPSNHQPSPSNHQPSPSKQKQDEL